MKSSNAFKKVFAGALGAGTVALCLGLLLKAESVIAAGPEYMGLSPRVGQAYEIKGFWDEKAGIFVATDIGELPKPRRPKLRGAIQKIDRKDSLITMYGVEIKVYDKTLFLDNGEGKTTLAQLKKGQRAQISCKVTKEGQWKARKIKAADIKKSDKVKGTVTGASVDGNPPDTLFIHGLPILLRHDTDVSNPGASMYPIERSILGKAILSRHKAYLVERVFGEEFFLRAEYRQSLKSELEYDLSETFSADRLYAEPEIRFEMVGYWNDRLRTFLQLRMRGWYTLRGARDIPASREFDAHVITQAYVLFRDIGGKGIAVQIGRQDVDEPRQWLFDEYLDGIRVYYYGLRRVVLDGSLFHLLAPYKSKFRTWTDVLFQARWYFTRTSLVRAYFMRRWDTDEVRNREPVWWGVGYYGGVSRPLRPWLEIAYMRGQDKGKSLRAGAIDIGITAGLRRQKMAPSITLGYAVGTGGKSSGGQISNTFRQTGYDDNVDYFGGVSTLRYYGEIVYPELSNIKILTLAAGLRPTSNSSVEIIYHVYRQHRPDNKLRGGDLIDPPARPSGVSGDLGRELDFVAAATELWNRVTLQWVSGVFTPGQAFAPRLNKSTLNKLNVKINL